MISTNVGPPTIYPTSSIIQSPIFKKESDQRQAALLLQSGGSATILMASGPSIGGQHLPGASLLTASPLSSVSVCTSLLPGSLTTSFSQQQPYQPELYHIQNHHQIANAHSTSEFIEHPVSGGTLVDTGGGGVGGFGVGTMQPNVAVTGTAAIIFTGSNNTNSSTDVGVNVPQINNDKKINLNSHENKSNNISQNSNKNNSFGGTDVESTEAEIFREDAEIESLSQEVKSGELTDDDDDLPLSKVRLREKPLHEKVDLPATISDTFETFINKRNSFTWEAFLEDFRSMPAAALDETQLQYVISNTHLILRETLPVQQLFSESKTDEKNLAKSISHPLFGLFRFLYTNEDKSKKPFQTMLTDICTRIPETGYLLLYFMKVHVKLQTRKNTQQTAQFKTSIYRLLCDAVDEKIDTCLGRDLDMLEKENTNIYLWLLPDIYREFKSTAINNNELLRITLRCIDAKNLRDLLYYIAQGKLTLFKQDGLIDCIRESLIYETFEQLCLWQLIQAHDIPLKCIQVRKVVVNKISSTYKYD